MGRMFSWACILWLTTGVFLYCSGNDGTQTEKTVVSIKNISQICGDEVFRNERLKSEYSRIILRYKKAARIVSADSRLQAFLELKQLGRNLRRELQAAQESQVQLLLMIDQIGKGRELLPQEVPYVLSNRSKISRLGKNQQVMVTFLRRMDVKINRNIRNMPLPKDFVNKFGMKMILVSLPRKTPFYVSLHPLSWKNLPAGCPSGGLPRKNQSYVTGLTFRQAQSVCLGLQSEEEGFEYRLPTYDELKMLEKAGIRLPLAVWSRSVWTEDWKEEECCKRFGVTMLSVWDSGGLLKKGGASAFFPELPDAFYDQLGMIVVSPEKSGVFSRFRRVQKTAEEAVSGQILTGKELEK